MAGSIAKRSAIRDSGLLEDHMETFDFHLGTLGALVSKHPETRKRMALEKKPKGLNVGTRESVTHIWCTLDFKVFKIIWGHSVHGFQNGLYL